MSFLESAGTSIVYWHDFSWHSR